MNSLRLIAKSTALAASLALGVTALGQTQGFVQKTRTVRAAVVLLDSDKPTGPYLYGQTASPFAFYNLDQSGGVKPSGWNFINPYAPGTVDGEVLNRYKEIETRTAYLPATNVPVGKSSGAYWTVRLSQLSASQISNYDVLLVAPKFNLSLNPTEREQLRRFVDGGGVLWIDASVPNTVDPINGAPFAFATVTGTGAAYRDPSSPLITGIRQVSDNDLNVLNGGSQAVMTAAVAATDFSYLPLSGEFLRYRPVAVVGNLPVMAEAKLGAGTIVVTTRGASTMLNQSTAPSLLGTTINSNVGYTAGAYTGGRPGVTPQLTARGRAAARLAVNIVSLSGGFRQPGGGTRRSNSDASDTSAPVLSRLVVENQVGPSSSPIVLGTDDVKSSPVLYKGYLVASMGNRIAVFDSVPGRDLDGDGDSDDGIDDGNGNAVLTARDSSVGRSMDLIWYSDVINSNGISSPVCAEVPEAGGTYTDQILVTDADGTLFAYQLKTNYASNGRLIGGQHTKLYSLKPVDSLGATTSGQTSGALGIGINPPTVYDGLAYMADTTNATGAVGRVWVADLTTGQILKSTNPWNLGGPASAGASPPAFTSGATIGYIPSTDGSGGTERVLYAPGVSTTNYQPTIVSMWLGSKGEVPANVEVTGGFLRLTTRQGGNNAVLPIYFPDPNASPSPAQKQLGVRLSLVDANGNPLGEGNSDPTKNMSYWVRSGPSNGGLGVIQYSTSKSLADFTAAGLTPRIDYSIDWGENPQAYGPTIERGRLLLPIRKVPVTSPDKTQRILGPIALTSRGTMHMVEGPMSGGVGGSYFAIREDGGNRGLFRVVSRFTLYNAFTQTFEGVSGSVPPVLEDNDGVTSFLPPAFRNQRLSSFRYAGGIALRNGIAYATINAGHGLLPVTMVAAFRAEPETPEIRIGAELGANPRLQQADFARTGLAISQSQQVGVGTTLGTNQMVVDLERGTLRLDNLATVNRGEITDCISLSQPVGVGWQNRAVTFRQPDAFGDRWSPLLWFGLWNGGVTTGAPLIAGNEVFISATTVLPSVLATPPSFTTSAVVWSVDADVPTSGLYAVADPNRPWIVQAAQIIRPDSALDGIEVSPYYRMPQNQGVKNFSDWKLRLEQTKMGNSTKAYGVAGGEGTVNAWGDRGLYGLSRADFVVCDEGRLLRVDSSGNPISNAFGGRFSGIGNGGSASEIRPLVRPVKAHPVGDGDYLVVDAAANRVIRLDEDGTELRSIDRILLDPAHKPAAYRANEPLTLNDPRDAATYEGYVYKGSDPETVTDQQATEYWVRTIVADSGNRRIVELADRYAVDSAGRIGAPISLSTKDPETGVLRDVPQVGVLVWKSPSLEQATKIGDYYNSISRVFVGSIGGTDGRYVYVTSVSRTRPTRSSAGLDNPNAGQLPSAGGGGAIVIFDPLGGTRVFDRFATPDLSNTKFFDPTVPNGSVGNYAITAKDSRATQNDRPFTGLAAVSTSTVVSGTAVAIRLMVTDQDAVYEFFVDSTILADPTKDPTKTAGGVSLQPSWFINEAAFTALRRPYNGTTYDVGSNAKSFRPAYARRLDSGEVLIVNGYRGLTRGGAANYKGEVIVLDGTTDYDRTKDNLGFSLGSLHFELTTLNGSARELVSPVFADRK